MNVKEILGMKDELTVSFEADMSGEGLTKNDIDAQMSLDFGRIKALNNECRNVAILGDIENQRFVVSTNVDSDILKLDLEAMMDVSDSSPAYDAKINVKKADLYKLNLLDNDEKMVLSTNINAKLSGNDIDKIGDRDASRLSVAGMDLVFYSARHQIHLLAIWTMGVHQQAAYFGGCQFINHHIVAERVETEYIVHSDIAFR